MISGQLYGEEWDSEEYQIALKVVLKIEIQSLIERLAEAGEETVLLTASPDDESTGHLSSNNARKFVATKDANLFKDKFLNFLLDGPNEDVESLFKTNPGKKAFDSNAGTYSKLVHTKGLGPITASQSTLHKPASSHSTLPVKRQVDQASFKPPQPDAKRVKLDIAATAGKTGLQSSGIKSPLITNTTKNNQMSPSVVKGHQNLATLKAQAKPTLETTKVVSKSGGFTEERISNAQFRKFVEKYSRGEGACSEEGYSLQSPHTPSHLITPSRGNKSLGQISNTTSVSSSIKDNNSVELNSPHAASSQSGKQDSMQLAKTVKDIKSNSDNKLKVDSKHKTESGKVSPVHGTNSTKLNTDKSTKLKDGIKTKVDCQTASVSKPKVDIDSIKNIEDIDTETLIKMTKEKHLENMSEADKQINAKLGMLTSKMSWVVEYPDKAEKQAGRQPVPAPGDANHSAMMEIYEEMEEEDYDEEEDDEYDEEGLDEEDRAKLQAMREAGHKLAIDGQHPQSDFHAGAMAGQFCMTEDEYDEQGGYGDYATYNQAGQMVMMPNTLSEGHKGDEQLYQRCSSPYLDSFLMIGPMLAKCLVCNKMVRKTEAKQHSSLHQQEQEEQEESEGYSVEECDQVEGYGQYQDEEQFPTDGEYQAEQGQYSAEQGQYSAEQGQYPTEQGEYPTGEEGEYPTGEEGEYPTGEEGEYQTEQGVYPVDEQGQYPAHNQGEYSAHNQGEYPAHEQGEYPAHENEEYPVDEEGEYSGEAEDEYDEEAPEYTAEKFVAEPLTAEKISDVGDASDNLFQDKSGKTLICDICNKICKTHSNMLRHRQTHTRTKDFPCPKCTKTFKLQINLTKHLQKAHPVHPEGTAALFNEVEDVFSPCTVCPRQFANKASLAEHMQTEHASSNIPNSN